jgi:hypothetical protein
VFERGVRWVLGGIFCLSSIAKAVAIGPFVLTVQRLTGVSADIAVFLAWATVFAEGALGLLLLSGRWSGVSLPVAAAILVGFAFLLLSFLLRREQLLCNCFGTFFPRLPSRAQILLDLALAAMGVLATPGRDSPPSTGLSRRRTVRILGTAAVLLLCTGVVASLHEPRPPKVRGQFSLLAERSGPSEEMITTPIIFFLVDFSDFGCVLCLDDFLAMADSVDRLTQEGKIRTQLISRRHPERSPEAQQRMLKGWMEGNRYGFDARVDEDSLFERTQCKRTTMVVLDDREDVLFSGTFPLGPARREEVLQALRREK